MKYHIHVTIHIDTASAFMSANTISGYYTQVPTDLDDASRLRDDLQAAIYNTTWLVLFEDSQESYFYRGMKVIGPAETSIPQDLLQRSVVTIRVVEAA